jgi:branched-chain amino acid transport system substrate-binding protein
MRIGPDRRGFLTGMLGAGAALATARRAHAAAAEPLRIGILNSFTGNSALQALATLDGFYLFFEQENWRFGDRLVQLIKEDDHADPQIGLEKARKLVEHDKCHIVCGPLLNDVALAMVDYMREARALWLVTGAGVTSLTQQKLPYMFRPTLSDWQVAAPMGRWVFDNMAKTVVLAGSESLIGHDALGAFREGFITAGGKILKAFYSPPGTLDFKPQLAQIRELAPSAVYSFFGGANAVDFVLQYAELGLKQRIPLVAFQSMFESDTFMGQQANALGCFSSGIYCDTLDAKENIDFAAAFVRRFGDYPSWLAESSYTASRIIADAFRATDGAIENRDRFAGALSATNIVAPRGPVRFDPVTHQAIQNVYVRMVDIVGDRIANRVVATLAKVKDLPATPI